MTYSLFEILIYSSYLAVERGRLQFELVEDADNALRKYMNENPIQIIAYIASFLEIPAYQYIGYETGYYVGNKKDEGGLTLQFLSLLNNESAYTIFNVNLNRRRGVKKGTRLPRGRFRVGLKHLFVKFWRSTGLRDPRGWSECYEHMGKLKKIIFTGKLGSKKERLESKSLEPLNISFEQIKKSLTIKSSNVGDSSETSRQNTGISPVKKFGNSNARETENSGFQTNSSTGISNYGKSKQEETVYGPPNTQYKVPSQQTTEEWLQDYNK